MAKVELLYFDGCPGYRKAEQDLKDALSREGIRSEVKLVAVNTDAEAGALEFSGSPTIRVDDRDLFPTAEREDWRVGCRVYATPEGLKGHPTQEMILAALRRSPVRATDKSGETGSRKSVEGEDAEDPWSAGLFGVPFGVLATRIDHIFFLSAIVLQPLTFLGGVFYSAEMLPAPLRAATYLDPIFYAVDAFRFAAVGVSDTPPYPALAALGLFAVLSFWGTTELLRRGYKLRY